MSIPGDPGIGEDGNQFPKEWDAYQDKDFHFDIVEETGRFFDDSSLPASDARPRLVLIAGPPAVGKTRIRKAQYSTGHVLIDAGEIFLHLSRGGYYPFPVAFEEPMEFIGRRVAQRAVSERRNMVLEVIGGDVERVKSLLDSIVALGYEIDLKYITCDFELAVKRNLSRGRDNISAFYAESFQLNWLREAADAARKTLGA